MIVMRVALLGCLIISRIAYCEARSISRRCNISKAVGYPCGSGKGISTPQECEAVGCCWSETKPLGPFCFDGMSREGYTLQQMKKTDQGYEGILSLVGEIDMTYGPDIKTLKVEVLTGDSDYVRLRITDAVLDRWQIPIEVIPRPGETKSKDNLSYYFTYTESPFTIEIFRSADMSSIFKLSGELIFKDQYIEFTSLFEANSKTFGLGESSKLQFALRPGDQYTLWAHDIPSMYPNTNLYGSYPYYLQMRNSQAHGVMLFNSNGMDVFLNDDSLRFSIIGGIIDLYVFVGPTPNQVSAQLTSVIGKPAMMPYWAYGFHNCKYGYSDLDEVKSVVQGYLDAGIPLDTQWVDIDYMDAYKDFTYDAIKFPVAEVAAFVDDLHSRGMHFVTIVDPGIMALSGYKVYDEGLDKDVFIRIPWIEDDRKRQLNGSSSYYMGQVWPGPVHYPDFTHPNAQRYWTDAIQDFYDMVPIDGLWIDMNEVSNFCNNEGSSQVCEIPDSGCPVDGVKNTNCCLTCKLVDPGNKFDFPPYAINNVGGRPLSVKSMSMAALHYGNVEVYNMHNLYGLTEQIASKKSMTEIRKKRPFVLSRSGFLSSGAHTAKWTGDNAAMWADLKASIVGILDLSIFGVAMAGADVCGFILNTTEELCARWIEVGSFYPFVRDHNDLGQAPQELYLWDTVATAAKTYLAMRYELLPYIYTSNYMSNTKGYPLARPLWYNFPSDDEALVIDEQFMLSDAVLVSPVLEQGITEVNAYFPSAVWYDFSARHVAVDTSSSGGGFEKLYTPLTTTNVHIRGGYVLPLQEAKETTTASRVTPFVLFCALNSDGDASGSLFWDDGEQIHLDNYLLVSYTVTAEGTSGTLHGDILHASYQNADTLSIQIIEVLAPVGLILAPSTALLDGTELDMASSVHYDATKSKLVISNLNVSISQSFVLTWY